MRDEKTSVLTLCITLIGPRQGIRAHVHSPCTCVSSVTQAPFPVSSLLSRRPLNIPFWSNRQGSFSGQNDFCPLPLKIKIPNTNNSNIDSLSSGLTSPFLSSQVLATESFPVSTRNILPSGHQVIFSLGASFSEDAALDQDPRTSSHWIPLIDHLAFPCRFFSFVFYCTLFRFFPLLCLSRDLPVTIFTLDLKSSCRQRNRFNLSGKCPTQVLRLMTTSASSFRKHRLQNLPAASVI
jgi:hypothetical protein